MNALVKEYLQKMAELKEFGSLILEKYEDDEVEIPIFQIEEIENMNEHFDISCKILNGKGSNWK